MTYANVSNTVLWPVHFLNLPATDNVMHELVNLFTISCITHFLKSHREQVSIINLFILTLALYNGF